MKSSKAKLPLSFKPLFWSYDFDLLDPQKHKRAIIVNVLNYGDLSQWQWLIKTYGKREIKEFIENIPASEFRKPILILISLLLGIKEFKYVSRSDYIRTKKNLE